MMYNAIKKKIASFSKNLPTFAHFFYFCVQMDKEILRLHKNLHYMFLWIKGLECEKNIVISLKSYLMDSFFRIKQKERYPTLK